MSRVNNTQSLYTDKHNTKEQKKTFILRIDVFKWMNFWWGTAPPAHTDEPRLTVTVFDIHFKGLVILTGDTTNVTVFKNVTSLTIVYFINSSK